jgi:hypothetical protein
VELENFRTGFTDRCEQGSEIQKGLRNIQEKAQLEAVPTSSLKGWEFDET